MRNRWVLGTFGLAFSGYRWPADVILVAVRWYCSLPLSAYLAVAPGNFTNSERKGAEQAFAAIVTEYLSRAHRDAVGQGCVVAALGAEIARQPQSVREAFTEEFKDALTFLAEVMPGDDPARRYEDAIAAFAAMAGALTLARAVSDETLSDLILNTTAKRLIDPSNLQRAARRS